jgi:hypothetical protein
VELVGVRGCVWGRVNLSLPHAAVAAVAAVAAFIGPCTSRSQSPSAGQRFSTSADTGAYSGE